MKRLIAVLLVAVLMMTFLTACGKNRLLYKSAKLEKYVEVSDYIGVEVDTTTDEFAKLCDEVYAIDVTDYALYNEVDTVQDGDIVNLDYEGKLDGVAFEGGTAQGYELEIGSKTFIDDFEEELIGAIVGETRDVTAKFPENYGKTELNGKEAIFTCKINSIKREMTKEEAYSKADFNSLEEYEADIKERAVKQYILNTVSSKAKIKDYPKKDSELLRDAIFDFYVEIYKKEYGVDFEQIIVSNGSTIEEYKSQISTEMVPQMMNVNMVMYYILDTEELELLDSTIKSQATSQPAIAESYAVQDIVMEYLYDNAKIK